MNDLQDKFEQMVIAVRDGKIRFSPTNTQKLKLYAFYKQAKYGDIQGECPSVVNVVERAKWQAWNSIKGMSTVDAMQNYLNVFTEVD